MLFRSGSASSDGVDLGLADVARLIRLHSEVNSEGQGHSYLVGLNGTEIGTDDQLGQACALEAVDLVALSCLQASGGPVGGLLAGSAELLGVTSPLGTALDPVAAFSATASSGTGSDPISVLPTTAALTADAETARSVTPAAAATSGATAGQGLARTGVAVAAMAAAALAALLAGAVLRLLGRRRVTA